MYTCKLQKIHLFLPPIFEVCDVSDHANKSFAQLKYMETLNDTRDNILNACILYMRSIYDVGVRQMSTCVCLYLHS